MGIKVFWLEPIERMRLSLRRYAGNSKCPGKMGYHDAKLPLFEVLSHIEDWDGRKIGTHDGPKMREDVPAGSAWPTHCECGYEFQEGDEWQVFSEALYRRVDTGEIVTLRDAPPGAMWDAFWIHDVKGGFMFGQGADGIVLMVKLPNGNDWCVDQRASNCTMPNDDNHRCWCRHGDPRTGNVHVDKSCTTCQAGAGSIQSGDYHGFLHNGELTT